MQARRITLKDLNIDKTWSLFLDRDGVLNKRLEGDYVKTLDEFEFLEQVPEALKILTNIFGKIFIVTNQQGIGKGLYTENDLNIIHHYLADEVEKHGGKIDKIYFSPHLAALNHPSRKPGIGMALQAKDEHPEVDFSRSLIIGDSMSDMEFGRAAGMRTVFISEEPTAGEKIDFNFASLFEFASEFQ